MIDIYSKKNIPANFLLCDEVDNIEKWRYECIIVIDSCLDFFECFPENWETKVKALQFESEEKCNELFIKLINSVPHSTFEDIVSAKEFLDHNEFPCGCVLCGQKFTDEFLSCFEPYEIYRTNLIDDDTAYLFSLPQFVGAMPNNNKQFGMAIMNKDSFCRILKSNTQ
jgi:hypothetical protein